MDQYGNISYTTYTTDTTTNIGEEKGIHHNKQKQTQKIITLSKAAYIVTWRY